MSQKGSVFQKGGGGTNFEQLVQTAFLTTLIIHGNAPCLDSAELLEVALQVTNRGYETDDFMVTAKSASGEHRVLIQVKHDISFTVDNRIFKEVINAFWKDYNNTSIFDKSKDKLIIVKNGLTKDERNHLKSLFNWAKNHATEADFITEVNRIRGKKDRLDVFREVLKEANNNTYLTDKELWEFLKCVDVLEYDFLNEGSIDKTYFLNLIKLSKNKKSAATEKEIWDSIFAYVATLNPNGGSVTLESIRDKDFFQHFDNTHLTPYFKAVEKLKSDSNEILRPIKTYIGKGESEFHLQRSELREKILVGLSNSQLTIVTGKPGVGKSAEIKETLEKDYPNASVFVFRADQFNESTLANVFSSQGVNETIQDIFSCISLIPEKIIFVDSLEKLLEADPECAFKQLLALLKEHPEIKLIASSRKYAIDLITLKFGIDKDNISSESKKIWREVLEKTILLIAPFAPHVADELWAYLGNKTFTFEEEWPKYDEELTKDHTFNLVIQVNGKVRDMVSAQIGISKDDAEKLALESEKAKKFIDGKEIVKVIVVPNKLVNVVVKG